MTFSDLHPRWRLSEPSSLISVLRARADASPDRIAFRFLADGIREDSCLTYKDLDAAARVIAGTLQTSGLEHERIVLMFPTAVEFIAAFFGCIYAGAIAVPALAARGRRHDSRLINLVTDARASAVIASESFSATAEKTLQSHPQLAGLRWIRPAEWAAHDGIKWTDPNPSPDSLAYLQYTSGSTNDPKGVMIKHRNVLDNLRSIDLCFQHDADTVAISWLPHFHDMGLVYGIIQPIYNGFPCCILSPAAFAQSPSRWLQAITHYKGSHSGGPNFAFDLCLRKVSEEDRARLDLGSWRVAFNGAEPIRSDTLREFAATFSSVGFRASAFFPAYGLAEATLKVTCRKPDEPVSVKTILASALPRNLISEVSTSDDNECLSIVGCGPPPPGTEVAIIDPDNLHRRGENVVGEIWISGPAVADGYWNRQEENRQIFGAHIEPTGEGPYLRTGDLGFIRGGELFVTGRLKDVIIIRGGNHYPQDIEKTAADSHPALRHTTNAAFGRQISGRDQLIIVQEIAKERSQPETEEIFRALRSAVAEQHHVNVHTVAIVKAGTIPKTTSGKVERRRCRLLFESGELAIIASNTFDGDDLSESELPAGESARTPDSEDWRSFVLKEVARVLRRDADLIPIDSPLSAIGLDSLRAAELAGSIDSRIGVALTIVELIGPATVSSLCNLIQSRMHHSGVHKVAALPVIETAPESGDAPASPEQERLWMLDKTSAGRYSYQISAAFPVHGALSVRRLQNAVRKVVLRHDSLRTRFVLCNGQLRQVIDEELEVTLPVIDLSRTSGPDEIFRSLTASTTFMISSLDKTPLLHFQLYQLGSDCLVFVIALHHIIADAISLQIIVRELEILYRHPEPDAGEDLPELPVRYRDYANWLRNLSKGPLLDESREFWRREILGSRKSRGLMPRPPGSGATRSQEVSIGANILDSLNKIAADKNVTCFMVFAAAFATILHLIFDEEEVTFGVPTSGRRRQEVQNLVGLFAYPLIFRTQISEGDEFEDILNNVRASALNIYEHDALPFSDVLHTLFPNGGTQSSPLFQRIFTYLQWQPVAEGQADSKFRSPYFLRTATDIDFSATIVSDEEKAILSIQYNTGLFRAEEIKLFGKSYLALLERCLRTPSITPKLLREDGEISGDLVAVSSKWRPYQITVASTFTADPIGESLGYWLRSLEIPHRIELAPYNQVFQQLLDPGSLIRVNKYGVNILLIRLQDWLTERGEEPADSLTDLQATAEDFTAVLKGAGKDSPSPFILIFCPSIPGRRFIDSQLNAIAKMENELVTRLQSCPNIHVVEWEEIDSNYPIGEPHDPVADTIGHLPYTDACFAAMGTACARKIIRLQMPSYKVIVCDCDNTLWDGVCAEDGSEGVTIGDEYRQFQGFLAERCQAGMLLCLCSKNSQEDVWAVFDRHPQMLLRRDLIVSARINWEPKVENLKALSEELGLALNDFVFIDDDPFECDQVRAACPEVLVIQSWPPNTGRSVFWKRLWPLDPIKATAEDTRRSELYRQHEARERVRRTAPSFETFLATLDLKVDFECLQPQHVERVAQLTVRTTQFNLNNRRWLEAELNSRCRESDPRSFVVYASDKFGDYGLVGFVAYSIFKNTLKLEAFLLSCRALEREIEYLIWNTLVQRGRQNRAEYIELEFQPTARNKPAMRFLESLSNGFYQPQADRVLYRFPCEKVTSTDHRRTRLQSADQHRTRQLSLVNQAGARSVFRTASASAINLSMQFENAEDILRAVRKKKKAKPSSDRPLVMAETLFEQEVAAVWAEVLGLDQVSIHDNFFEIGGHSLAATQIVSRLSRSLGVELSLTYLIGENPTIAVMAEMLEQMVIKQASDSRIAGALAELEHRSEEQEPVVLSRETEL